MIKEKKLILHIQALQEAIQNGVNTMGEAELKNIRAELVKARQEYTQYMSEGAVPCPVCGNLPIGLRRGTDPRYEVGCIGCVKPRRARGDTREEAVENWNNNELVKEIVSTPINSDSGSSTLES